MPSITSNDSPLDIEGASTFPSKPSIKASLTPGSLESESTDSSWSRPSANKGSFTAAKYLTKACPRRRDSLVVSERSALSKGQAAETNASRPKAIRLSASFVLQDQALLF